MIMWSLSKATVRPLAAGYLPEADTVDEATWYRILGQFEDANIYQTWAYDEVRCGRKNISHVLLKKDGRIVAAAQSRILKVPLLKAGIAYVRWGPLWRRHDEEASPETFRQAIRALRNEYACRRGLVLRLYPVLFRESSSGDFTSILAEEGFSCVPEEKPDRTLVLDLSRPIEELRKGLRPHWHRYLKVAERNGLEIVEGSDDTLFDGFLRIYREMVGRKRFIEPNDINDFKAMQRRLPPEFKMKIKLCKSGENLCAGLISGAIGKTAVYLFGATSNLGLKSRGSYLLHWKLIEELKAGGFIKYDLHGIDPVANPGTYKFKADLCGNNGADVRFLGRFDSRASALSNVCVHSGDGLRMIYRTLRSFVNRQKQAPGARLGYREPVSPGPDLGPGETHCIDGVRQSE